MLVDIVRLWLFCFMLHRLLTVIRPSALTPRALPSIALPISYVLLPHPVSLQRDLPSLPSVTNCHATGLGLCINRYRYVIGMLIL